MDNTASFSFMSELGHIVTWFLAFILAYRYWIYAWFSFG